MLVFSPSTPLVPRDNWKLVWSDEFNSGVLPDDSKWSFEQGFVRNRELQWYQPANATVHNGALDIEGRREAVPNPDYQEGSKDWRKNRPQSEFTSACLETRGKASWLYGRFEVRAKIDPQMGLWPAIWLLGVQGQWPKNGEVDVLEFYQNTILANSCWGDGVWNTQKHPFAQFLQKDKRWGDKFHVWRMDWDPDFIRIYLDKQLVNETDLSKTINPDGSNPFHKPMFLLLNLAIGSTGGDTSQTKFPTHYLVDYVRVYQKLPPTVP